MDVALHRCGVTFVLDRAGVTGPDGASHHGMWDMSILQVVPGLQLTAPRDGTRLREALATALTIDDAPTVIRYSNQQVPADLDAVDHDRGHRHPGAHRAAAGARRRLRGDGGHRRRGRPTAVRPGHRRHGGRSRCGRCRSTPPCSTWPAGTSW